MFSENAPGTLQEIRCFLGGKGLFQQPVKRLSISACNASWLAAGLDCPPVPRRPPPPGIRETRSASLPLHHSPGPHQRKGFHMGQSPTASNAKDSCATGLSLWTAAPTVAPDFAKPGTRPASGSPVNLSGSGPDPLAQFRLAFHCLAPCLLRPALHRLLRHENQGLQHLHQKVSDQAAVLLDR